MSLLKRFIVSALLAGNVLLLPATVLAADPPKINPKTNCPDSTAYKNSVCLKNPLTGGRVTAGEIISTIIKGALSVVGALALLMLVLGGFRWLTSAGNTEKIESGTKTMVWAVIGLFLVLASYVILTTFTDFLTGAS